MNGVSCWLAELELITHTTIPWPGYQIRRGMKSAVLKTSRCSETSGKLSRSMPCSGELFTTAWWVDFCICNNAACKTFSRWCCCHVHSQAMFLQPLNSNIVKALQTTLSLVCGQLLMICSIVCHLPRAHLSVFATPTFFWQDEQCPW